MEVTGELAGLHSSAQPDPQPWGSCIFTCNQERADKAVHRHRDLLGQVTVGNDLIQLQDH